MSDIIERNAKCARQLLDCAAEIKRLTAEVTEDHALLVACEAEIERLRAGFQRIIEGGDAYVIALDIMSPGGACVQSARPPQVDGWMAYCPATGGRLFAYSESSAREQGATAYAPREYYVAPVCCVTDPKDVQSALTATPDPSTPQCSRCGGWAHDPCQTDEQQSKCQLPDFCFIDPKDVQSVCTYPVCDGSNTAGYCHDACFIDPKDVQSLPTLPMGLEQRLADAEADVLRLHKEKCDLLDRAIEIGVIDQLRADPKSPTGEK